MSNEKIVGGSCKYRKVAEQISFEIFMKYPTPNTPLPSIREYAEIYHVNPNTIAKALRFLSTHGIVYADRTKGYYVGLDIEDKKIKQANTLAHNLLCNLKNIGYTKEEISSLLNIFVN